jgi:hypothetical protein
LIRPAFDSSLIKIYTPERKAEFLLSNAVDEEDYQNARQDVRELGIAPDSVAHLHLGDFMPGKH